LFSEELRDVEEEIILIIDEEMIHNKMEVLEMVGEG